MAPNQEDATELKQKIIHKPHSSNVIYFQERP